MSDKFQNRSSGYTGPATHARSITPSDSSDLADVPRWLMAETGGTISVDMLENASADNPVSLVAEAGQVIFVRPSRIYATGTTATGITAFW